MVRWSSAPEWSNKLLALRGARNKHVIPSEARDLDSSVATLPRNDKSNKEKLLARIEIRFTTVLLPGQAVFHLE